jgi:CRISPR-associated protein Csb1
MSSITLDEILGNEGPRRLILKAELAPVTGSRFQPAGFPEIGHVIYDAPINGKDEKVCIVDSAASMANHLEKVCWDEAKVDIHDELKGLPYIRLEAQRESTDPLFVTCSILQDHRIASSYFIEGTCSKPSGKTFGDFLQEKAGFEKTNKRFFLPPTSRSKAIEAIFDLDPSTLIHGVFFPQKRLGNFRLSRLLSANCEAFGARRCMSAGVKFDPIGFKHAKDSNYGQSIFQKDEETAERIEASFVVDIQQIRGFGLSLDKQKLLLALSLWKIKAFLQRGTRLRSNCDLVHVPPLQAWNDLADDKSSFNGESLLSLAANLKSLIEIAYRGHESNGAFVVLREYNDLISKAGQPDEESGDADVADASVVVQEDQQ